MKTCKDCHFLVKRGLGASTEEAEHWSSEEREKESVNVFNEYHGGAGCYKEVWWKADTDIEGDISRKDYTFKAYLSKPRSEKGGCFFFDRQEGMTFPAAVELENRENEARVEARRSQANLHIAIIAAVTASVLTALLTALLTR